MSTFDRLGARVLAQDYLRGAVHSRFFQAVPLAYLLLGTQGPVKTENTLGTPDTGVVLAGNPISPAQRQYLSGLMSIEVDTLKGYTDNSKVMGARDTMPVNPTATTTSDDQNFGMAGFSMCRLSTPIYLWKHMIDKALGGGTDDQKYNAATNLIENAVDVALSAHVRNWSQRFWFGNPSNQSAEPWDNILGLVPAINATNIYGRVDRSNPAAAEWRGNVVTTPMSLNPFSIVDDANYNQGIALTGQGANLLLVSPSNYVAMKAVAVANGAMPISEGLPEMAAIGVKREVIKVNDAYVVPDPKCPLNSVAVLNLRNWEVVISDKHNFIVTEFGDQGMIEGGKDAWIAYVDTALTLICREPKGQVFYTNVS